MDVILVKDVYLP